MKEFTYFYPTKVYFGEGSAAKALNAELPKFGETVLLAYGSGSVKKNGIYDELKSLLEKSGKTVDDDDHGTGIFLWAQTALAQACENGR